MTLMRMSEWVSVCRLNEVKPHSVRAVSVNGVELVVGRVIAANGVSDDVVALGGRCPYKDAPLADASLRDGVLVCPLHGCEFEITSGISPHEPDQKIRVFDARLAGGLHGTLIQVRVRERGPGVGDGYLARWIKRKDVEPELAHMRSLLSPRSRVHHPLPRFSAFDALALTPVPLSERYAAHSVVNTACTLGSRALRPLTLSLPVMVGHISYGEVSIEAKIALARGARDAGTAVGSGDGGVHGRERDAAGNYVVQVLPHQNPSQEDLSVANAVELRLGEAARPGQPATLSAEQVNTEVSLHRGIPPKKPFTGGTYQSWAELEAEFSTLQDRVDGVPVGIKLAAGDVESDLAAVLPLEPDYVVLDTVPTSETAQRARADSWLTPHVGVDAPTALMRAHNVLDALPPHAPRPSIVISGGFHRGDEIVKALALGADAVAVSHAALLAVGCQQYRACHTQRCPVGIATHDPQLRLRLNADISAMRVSAYFSHLRSEITEACRSVGVDDVAALRGCVEERDARSSPTFR